MDYDATEIPEGYDRGREHGPEYLNLWMDLVSSHAQPHSPKAILDLGCGTGRFAEALAVRFDAQVVGLDPSNKMLEQARSKQHDSRVRYEQGRGEQIPLPDKSVDLIFISMVFHHFENPGPVARECRRVLRDRATLFLRAGTRECISSYPYVDFFPGSKPLLEECLSPGDSIREVFEKAGFQTAACELVTQQIAPNYLAYTEKLLARADSVLARLSQSEFASGIESLRSHAAQSGDRAVVEPIDVFVFRAP